jgi:HK97 family phage major capsid protein
VAVATSSFQHVLHPPEVAKIINLLLEGSPFANSLTRYPTGRSEVAFPTISPTAPAWTAEGNALPVIGLGDAAVIYVIKKLGEVLLLSNESISDTDVNLTATVGNMLKDAAGPELDRGLLYGTLAAEPAGVVPAATAADATDLPAAITLAIGQIGDAGGTATHLAMKPSILAKHRNDRDTQQRPLWPDGIGAHFGLTEVPVPNLADALVYDKSRCYLIVRTQEFEVALSGDYAFNSDQAAMRVRGRFTAGIPAPLKSVRKVTVAGVAPTAADRPAGKRAA